MTLRFLVALVVSVSPSLALAQPIVGDEVALGDGTFPQYRPAVASDGTNYLVVWQDERDTASSFSIYAQLVSTEGEPLGEAFRVSQEGSDASFPTVAYGDSTFVVAWYTGFIRFARVSTDGDVLTETPVTLENGTYPHAAFDGTNFMLFYNGTSNQILAQRVTPAGAVIDTTRLVVFEGSGLYPRARFNGEHYLLVWHSYVSSLSTEIYGGRVDTSGVLLDDPPVPIGTSSGGDNRPTVAGHPDGWLVGWHRSSSSSSSVRAARVSPDASVLDSEAIDLAPGTEFGGPVSVDHDGHAYISAFIAQLPGSTSTGVYLSRVTEDGIVLDSPPVELNAGAPDPHPAVAGGPAGQSLVAYGLGASDGGKYVAYRIVKSGLGGAACDTADSCESGHCVDGVCCDTACGGGADDCQACSVAMGAGEDGTCMPLEAGTVCRAASGDACDVDESCDGSDVTCPPDEPEAMCGTGSDAGTTPDDGGSAEADAGTSEPEPEGDSGGCSASSGGDMSLVWWLFPAFSLAIRRLTRRR